MSIGKLVLASLAASISVPLAAYPVIRPIAVAGYNMPNGSGVASGGTYNHWDRFYNGDGDTTTDGAPLSNGIGELADEQIASGPAHAVESLSGFGPWTGWAAATTPSPELEFYFFVTADGRFLVITSIDLHIDNSQIGGAFAPTAILIDGVSLPFVAPAAGTIGWVSVVTPRRIGGGGRVQLIHDTAPNAGWIFVSEFRFNGYSTPEPATWIMMITGFGLTGVALRRRNSKAGVQIC